MNKKLEEQVRDYLFHLNTLSPSAYSKETRRYHKILTKELIARKFGVKEHEIAHIFMKLNHEGLISQPKHHQGDDRWTPDIYYLLHPLSALFTAIKQDKKEKIQRILEKGVDINDCYVDETPLLYALKTNTKPDMIAFLLSFGANPTPNNDLNILKHCLNNYSSSEVFFMLLNACENPLLEDEDGDTILFDYIRTFRGNLEEILQYGFNINHKNKQGKTPLMLACTYENHIFAKVLLDHGASIKGTDTFGNSAFKHAYTTGNKELLQLFLPHREKLHRDEQKLFKKVRLKILF